MVSDPPAAVFESSLLNGVIRVDATNDLNTCSGTRLLIGHGLLVEARSSGGTVTAAGRTRAQSALGRTNCQVSRGFGPSLDGEKLLRNCLGSGLFWNEL